MAHRTRAACRFVVAQAAPRRCLSSTRTRRGPSDDQPSKPDGPKKVPAPPKPIDDSTSALDFKLSHPRPRPPPLPSIDPPRWSAEQAVTNILYNTPPPSTQPFSRHVLNCLVQNEPGVLSRVSGILAARGFNIDSLVVCATEIRDLSRMCIVLRGQDGVVEQARRQLEDLVPVWAVLDYTRTKTIERELCLAKVSILGPEYFEDQLHAKVEQSRLTEAEHVAAEDHAAAHPNGSPSAASTDPSHHLTGAHLSPSEALRQKHFHLQALTTLASQFQGKVVDVSHDCLTIEVSGKTQRIDAFLKLVRPYGILEAARTGVMVMPRAPIESAWRGMADEEAVEEIEAIDAGMLPPG